jgi:hypothetical protein
MRYKKSALRQFIKGFYSFAAILSSFYTSYPYYSEERLLTLDWVNIGDDLRHAIYKYDHKSK